MGWFNRLTGKEVKKELSEEEKASGEHEVKELQDNAAGKNPDAEKKDIKDINVNEEKESITDISQVPGPDPSAKAKDDKVYVVDIALKNEGESQEDFIERAKAQELGEWIDEIPKHVPDAEEKEEGPGNDNLGKEEEAPPEIEEEVKAETGQRKHTANEIAIDDIIAIRLGLDATHSKAVSHLGPKSECAKCIFVSKAWLGKVLAQLGTANPYPKAKTVGAIPPTQQVAENVDLYGFGLKDELDKINHLRDALAVSVDEIESLDFEKLKVGNQRLIAIAKTASYINACEARFDLGNELAIIRNR